MTTLIRNADGSVTTNAATLRQIFIAKILDEVPTDMNERLEEKIKEIIAKAINDESADKYDKKTVTKINAVIMFNEIDELIQNEKKLLEMADKTTAKGVWEEIYGMLEGIDEISSMEHQESTDGEVMIISYDDGTQFEVTIKQIK